MEKPIFNMREPIYQQIIRYMERLIISEKLQPGQELPSRREFARFLEVNPNTVQRAFSEMEACGWIYTETGRPSRITENKTLIEDLKTQWLDRTVEEFIQAVRLVDIPLADFEGRLQSRIERLKKEEEQHD